MPAQVLAVHTSPVHAFSKDLVPRIELRAGHGVVGDTHAGTTVQHRSRVARDPSQPNLRQVHLIQGELVRKAGVMGVVLASGAVAPGDTVVVEEAPQPHVALRPV